MLGNQAIYQYFKMHTVIQLPASSSTIYATAWKLAEMYSLCDDLANTVGR
jgi:hypothetical protein